ncbi:hypothetical protein QTO30_00855 [Yoonia sp. GPGPB17]|uniref:hypothetical protein n=1 Tax=Yoonia sp. GPGPB17 TaxID=3026147 RepID=UPI0030BBAA74
MISRIALCLLVTSTAANAVCGPEHETFIACQIADRDVTLEVCFDADTASYSYGPMGAPELTLQEPVATLDYLPWPGAGSAIWEEVTFYSGPYSYTVLGGFERPFSEKAMQKPVRRFGGVTVQEGETTVTALTCAPKTVEFAWGEGLWQAKENLGLTWNYQERRWFALPD